MVVTPNLVGRSLLHGTKRYGSVHSTGHRRVVAQTLNILLVLRLIHSSRRTHLHTKYAVGYNLK